jgi:hypothetical protein
VMVDGSVDDAIKKIKDQLAAIGKETNPSEQMRAKKRVLERVVKELESVAQKDKQDKNAKVIGDKLKLDRAISRVVVRTLEDDKNIDDKKISAEAKAEIEKARAKIKELAHEVQSKQKELAEAKAKLAKLTVVRFRTPTGAGQANPALGMLEARAKELAAQKVRKLGVDRQVIVRRDQDAGQKRLDELEKKLEKLLDEVASLKKDRAK